MEGKEANLNAERVCAVGEVHVPEWTDGTAAIYFKILEAQFALKRITSSTTKFCTALTKLPPTLLARLPAAIIDANNYEELKAAVLCQYEATKPEIFEKLIKTTTFGGRPSIYLQEIQSLADQVGVGEELVRHKFAQSLPPNIAPIIASQKQTPLRELGTLADQLMPFSDQQSADTGQCRSPAAEQVT